MYLKIPIRLKNLIKKNIIFIIRLNLFGVSRASLLLYHIGISPITITSTINIIYLVISIIFFKSEREAQISLILLLNSKIE